MPLEQITSTLPPIDAVIFGGKNRNELLAPDGAPGPVMVEDAPNGQSIELRSTGLWHVQPVPTPGRGGLGTASVPEPLTLALFALGLALLPIARIRDL